MAAREKAQLARERAGGRGERERERERRGEEGRLEVLPYVSTTIRDVHMMGSNQPM